MAATAIVVGAAFLFFKLKASGFGLGDLTAWLNGLGPWAPVYWMLIVAAAVILIVPIPMIAAVSGFVFGPWLGPLYSLTGMEVGCLVAFLFGRLALAGKAGLWMARYPKLRRLNQGLETQGWKFISATRLLPGFPIKISNYAFGALGYSFQDFMLGNLLGLAPYQITGALAGSLLSDLATPGSVAALAREPVNLAVSVAGLAMGITLLVLSVRRAMRSLGEA